ncbi:hypothetical protein SO802_001012 [Lithocarpus litseifolius]|uniref:Uncharacterized protein n=1 Tax=Lithocarpus litseifolius TaxID=425828 RepID=A0AAW2DWJ7_9ROSI
MSSSDHSMLAIRIQPSRPRQRRSRPLFCFEAMWLQDPRCADIVQEAWHEGLYKLDGASITNYHASCRDRLSAWNKLKFGHVGNTIAKLNWRLQVLEHHPIRNDTEIQEEDDHTTENIILDYFETIFRSNGPTDTSVLVDAVQLGLSQLKKSTKLSN